MLTNKERIEMRAIRAKYEGQSTAPSMLFDVIEELLDELDERDYYNHPTINYANGIIRKLQADIDRWNKPCECKVRCTCAGSRMNCPWCAKELPYCPMCGHIVKDKERKHHGLCKT